MSVDERTYLVMSRAGIEAVDSLLKMALDTAQSALTAQLRAAQENLNDSAHAAEAFAENRDVGEVVAAQVRMGERNVDQALESAREILDLGQRARGELFKLMNAQAMEWRRNLNVAFDASARAMPPEAAPAFAAARKAVERVFSGTFPAWETDAGAGPPGPPNADARAPSTNRKAAPRGRSA